MTVIGERTHSHLPKRMDLEWKDIKRTGGVIRSPEEAN